MLSYDMNTQDQRCTSYPIWKVCDVELKYGVYGSRIDGYCVVDNECGKIFKTPKELIDRIIEVECEELDDGKKNIDEFLEGYESIDKYSLKSLFELVVNELGWNGYEYCGYIENVKTYGEFLTEKEAQLYLECNKHKYSKDVYLCVDSAYGNNQLMELIDILKKIRV